MALYLCILVLTCSLLPSGWCTMNWFWPPRSIWEKWPPLTLVGWWSLLQPSLKCQTQLASASRRNSSVWNLSTTDTRSQTPGESPELSAGARMPLQDMHRLPLSSNALAEWWIHTHTVETRRESWTDSEVQVVLLTFSFVCTHTNVKRFGINKFTTYICCNLLWNFFWFRFLKMAHLFIKNNV